MVIQNLIDTIDQIPTSQLSGEEVKQIALELLQRNLELEREAHILTFIEGQSKPHASFQAWADRKFNTLKTKTDDSE
jgi:hypothetical protein